MRVAAIALALLMIGTGPAHGQTLSADEKTLREIVGRVNAGERVPALITSDTVFWSGALVKPTVGLAAPQVRPGSSDPNERINSTTVGKLVQLVVSSSGDLAYEYSTFKSSWVRGDNNQKVELEGAVLRTWRKIDGQWTIGAEFRRPYDNSPTTG
jgi:ketosteroid isomerase-like protein